MAWIGMIGWHTQARWRMPSRKWRFKKSIRISSNEGELQIPKRHVD
jgi:hypothetical protein